MRGTVTYALAAAIAIALAAEPAARARPGAATKGKRPAAHTERSARSAVPARRPDRPRRLVRRGSDAALDPLARLGEEIRKVWSGRVLRRGTTAVYVVDAHSGEVLYAVNEDQPLNPASNVKLISTATVLDALGTEWRYTTRLFGPTPDGNGVANGDLYLLGSFDPTLSIVHLREIAQSLARTGVKKVTGDVLLGTGDRRDGVGLSRVQIHVTATAPGEPPEVTITPALDFVDLEVNAVTSKRRRVRLRVEAERVQSAAPASPEGQGPRPDWVVEAGALPPVEPGAEPPASAEPPVEPGAPDRLRVTVSGKIGVGRARTYKRWVPQRAELTLRVLRSALVEAGIEVEGGLARVSFEDYVHAAVHGETSYLPVELARHESVPIRDLVAKVNKRSINWLADALVKTAGAVTYGGAPDLDKGVHAMERWLQRAAGIDAATVKLDTGSGLSYKTSVTAQHIVRVLRTAGGFAASDAADEHRFPTDAFRGSLAIAGRDGTLRRRFRRSEVRGKLIGKTGTLTGIIALAGVLTASDGNALCFAIVTNQHRRGYRWRVKREHEKMVQAMYRFLEEREPTATASR